MYNPEGRWTTLLNYDITAVNATCGRKLLDKDIAMPTLTILDLRDVE